MLLRLLILTILAVVVYRAVRRWIGGGAHHRSNASGSPPEPLDDEMVKDPECGVYFPQRSAVALTDREGVLYFCSTECRDRYAARRTDGASQ